MYFKGKIEVSKLKQALGAMNCIVDECRLEFSTKGVAIRAIDAGNVVLADITLQREAFNEYESDESSKGEIGVDLNLSMDFFKGIKKGEIVDFGFNDSNDTVMIKNERYSRDIKTIDLATIHAAPEMPEIEFGTHFELLGNELIAAIERIRRVNTNQFLMNAADGISFLAIDEHCRDECVMSYIKNGNPAKTRYSIEYFYEIRKAMKNVDAVRVEMDTDKPAKLQFSIADGCGEVTYIIAPRIESD